VRGSVVPERVRLAVEALSVRPGDRLLELGCGGGVAVALTCERLESGTITAIDRSHLQIERAERRNAAYVASGKARFVTVALEELDFPERSFDRIFAIDVNHFWVRPATRELAALAGLLRPGGTLSLFYDPPAETRAAEIAATVARNLAQGGFAHVETSTAPLVGLTARPA
jgi:cyclopropane fatty-acyl-phospholipid synthase-like methyltransferase